MELAGKAIRPRLYLFKKLDACFKIIIQKLQLLIFVYTIFQGTKIRKILKFEKIPNKLRRRKF